MQHRGDDLQRLVEPFESVGERTELESELLVFEFEPAGSDTQDRPTAADDVERRHGLREHRRVPVGVAGDERGQLDRLGRRGDSGERRVRLEHRLVGLADAGELIEVVHHEHGIEPGRLGLARLGDDSRKQVPYRCRVTEIRNLVAQSNTHVGRRYADSADQHFECVTTQTNSDL